MRWSPGAKEIVITHRHHATRRRCGTLSTMAFSGLVRQVQDHLQVAFDTPSVSLNEKLLERIDRQATEAIEEPQRDALLNQLSQLLPMLQQDPAPVTDLINRLILPQQVDFSRVLSITPPVDFVAGLTSPLPPINTTTLCLVEKAKYRTSDIDILAGKPDVVGALVKLWLSTPDTAVATRAHDVLLGLLLADEESEDNIGSSFESGIMEAGLMWRRIFRDKDIYGSMFSICSLSRAGQEGQLSRREKTVAQARLLDMVLKIDSEPVRTSQIPEIEQNFGVQDGGLLHFAAIKMVDYKDDVLMHMTLLDFLAEYLSSAHTIIPSAGDESLEVENLSSYNLHFLRKHGLHDRSMAFFLNLDRQDPIEMEYLYGSSAKYVSTYCSAYPQDLLRSQEVAQNILNRLTHVLHNVSSGHWAQGQTPKHDLHVVASVPRAILLPRNQGSSPFFLVPATPPSELAFNTLAHIFHGSDDTPWDDDTADEVAGQVKRENATARALYYLYMDQSPSFWRIVVSAAEVVAVKDIALAAISLMGAVITAIWSPLDATSVPSSHFALPTEDKLAERCHANGVSLPASGIEAIMSEPAIASVLPYLMRPAQTFSNLVGGGRGDVESAAYRVAAAKHDVLILLHQRLKVWARDVPDVEEMVVTVGRRVAQGPMGGTSEVGGRIGTMEL